MIKMVHYWNPNVSLHQRYYSNPLNPIAPVWRIQLMMYSFKDTKRVSARSKYHPYQMRIKNLASIRYKNNPVVWILESKNERRVWGKFNR